MNIHLVINLLLKEVFISLRVPLFFFQDCRIGFSIRHLEPYIRSTFGVMIPSVKVLMTQNV